MMLQMVKVICSHCRQTIERGSGQNLNSLSCIQCVCLKCYENASSSDLRYKKLKQELDKANKKNQQLEKKCQNYQKELSQTNKSLQRCKKSKQGLEKNARMMENLVNKQLAQQMDRFTHFIDEILNREDCLQNFVTISIENLSSDIYKYASTLIERQTNFLLDILRTQIQNNSTLEYAMKQYSLNLKETFKTLSIKSNFSEDLVTKDHEMDKETAFLHQNKAKYFAQKETQTIEKIIRRKILSLKQRQEQLGFLIDMGHYISIKYVFKRRAERKIEEVSSKPKKEETLKPKQEISFKTNEREENIWKPNEEDSSKPKEENFLKPKEEDNQKPNEKEEDNLSAGNKENSDEFAMLNASESSEQGWSSDSHYENLTELEKPLEVKQNSTDINDCDQYW